MGRPTLVSRRHGSPDIGHLAPWVARHWSLGAVTARHWYLALCDRPLRGGVERDTPVVLLCSPPSLALKLYVN